MTPALALIGFMGAGKSAVGAAVAARTGAAFIDLDQRIEAAAGMPVARVFAERGEAAFRDLEADQLALALAPGAVLALGGGAPLRDASWVMLRQRAITIHLDAPFEVLWARTGADPARPLLAGGEGAARRLYEARRGRYAAADHSVDATMPMDMVVERVVQLWRG